MMAPVFRPAMLIVAITLFAAQAGAPTVPASLAAEVENTALAEMKTADIPGAAIGIVSGGRVLLVKGLGVASVETGVPVTADTVFRLGSTTKMFTAAAVIQMALDGKVDLRKPIGEYLNGLHPAIASMTVDQLLSHTAGFQNDDPPPGRADESALGKEIRSWKADRVFAAPGDVYSYSNLGYWVAGYVAETLAGKPYATVVEQQILTPLGMTRSTFYLDTASTFAMAQGHRGSIGKAVVVRPIPDNPAGWPSGALFSTANDLSRWLVALLNDGRIEGTQVLRKGLFDQLAAAHSEVPSTHSQYGYGLARGDHRGVTMLQHGGTRAGYGSFIRIVPEKKIAIVVLTNRQGQSLPKTIERASELLLTLEPRKESAALVATEMTNAEMAEYVGRYSNGGDPIAILVRDGRLFLRVDKNELELSKIGERRLMMQEPGASAPDQLVMLPDKTGRIAYIQIGSTALKRQE
jgi:CubicO group peptidase (beta-lactamase class C family)